MNILEVILIILGSLTLFAIILYACVFEQTIIKSTVSSESGEMDQYYYLPHAHLTLKATATIMVEKSAISKNILSHKLLQISFEPSIQITPDPESRVTVVYEGNWFANDEFQVVTSTDGLLENVKVVSEDRLSNIIAQVTQAPADSLAKMRTISSLHEKASVGPAIVEVVQETRVFIISSEELGGAEIKRDWLIPVKGQHDGTEKTVNATFTLKNSKAFEYKNQTGTCYNGLLTRPLVEQIWTLNKPGLENIFFTCLVPDTSALVLVPVKRSRFIKRQHIPKFHNGILLDNAIIKPSEFEGMISIPINILKAIVSIPAQLFHFRISRVRQETELQKVLMELVKAKNESPLAAQQSAESARLSREIEQLRNTLSTLDSSVQETGLERRIPKLGKLPASGRKGLAVRNFLKAIAAPAPNGTIAEEAMPVELPVIEEPHSWAEKNRVWDEYLNFDLKTCVPASGAYLLTSWTSNSRTPTIFLKPSVVIDTLKEVAPGGNMERGCDVSKFLLYWRDNGMGGERITDSFEISPGKPELLRQAIYWFGGCIVGLRLPSSLKTEDHWIYHSALETESKEGHAVCAVGYSGSMFTVISFGKEIRMDAEFYRHFNDETFLVLSEAHWTAINGVKAPTRPPADATQLFEIAGQLTTL